MSEHKFSSVQHDLKLIKGGGGGSSMVEERLRHLESDVAVIKATMLTKDDFNTAQLSLIRWIIGASIAIVSVISGLMVGIANMLVKALGQ